MHRRFSHIVAVLVAVSLSGCSSLGGLVASRSQASQSPVIEPVYVATVRQEEPDGSFGFRRSSSINYASYSVSVPPNRVPAQSPRYGFRNLDPGRDFVITSASEYPDATQFGKAVRTGGDGAPSEALVYVHGFNTGYNDSIYQLAQIGTDLNFKAARVLFAWPAQNKLLGYVHDIDSIAFARDSLERVLEDLAASGVKRITVVGYSMGALLVVETLRQMKLAGSPQFFAHLGGVVLLSPDIDVDLFRIEAQGMGGLPQPFIVYASPGDGALKVLTEFFTRDAPRLGSPSSIEALADLRMTFVDVSNVPQAKQPGHLPVATAPSMIAAINSMARPDLVGYAEALASGRTPGVTVHRIGKLTYVDLPKP